MFRFNVEITSPQQIEDHLVDAAYSAPGVIYVGSAEGNTANYLVQSEEYKTTRNLYAPTDPSLYLPSGTLASVDIAHEADVARIVVDRRVKSTRRLAEPRPQVDVLYLEAKDPDLSCLYFGVVGLYRVMTGGGDDAPTLEASWKEATSPERLEEILKRGEKDASDLIERLINDK